MPLADKVKHYLSKQSTGSLENLTPHYPKTWIKEREQGLKHTQASTGRVRKADAGRNCRKVWKRDRHKETC